MAPRRPTSTGIKRIESEEARQVCFSKRRKGLFKKLNELSIMCGSKVAAVVFSPGGKAFSFGHPSVDSVLNRFCTSNSSEAAVDGGDSDGEGDRSLALEELNREDRELCAQLAAIKARNEAVDEYFAKARADGCQVAAWLDMVTDVSQMSDEDLAAFQAALAKVGADVAARCNQVLQEALLFGRPMQGGGGGGGEFELGGTSASGGTEMAQQQQVMMLDMPPPPPPTGFAAGTEMMQQQMMLEMPPPPPRTGFAARTEMVQQQMMMLKMPPPPPPTGFAGTEMMQQQQMMMAMPPPTGLDGTEMVQQQMMLEMPPPPPRTGFAAGMEMVQQQMMMQEIPLTGFAAGTEMMQQQQMMMAMPPPPMGFAGMETVQQQQQMRMAMPPLPELAAAMGTLHQGFGHDFPQ